MRGFMRTLYNSVDIAATLRRFCAVCCNKHQAIITTFAVFMVACVACALSGHYSTLKT